MVVKNKDEARGRMEDHRTHNQAALIDSRTSTIYSSGKNVTREMDELVPSREGKKKER